jgi:2-keto-4-pentenoate hydratase
MASAAEISEIADRLFEAEEKGVPVAPPSRSSEFELRDAYAVQMRNVERHVAAGRRLVGKKVGLTSLAMQEALGVDQPDFGHLFEDMLLADGGTVDAGRFIEPRVEPEIAFTMSSDLIGPGLGIEDVREAVAGAQPALEVIDSRVANWEIGLVDTVADNASCGAVVLGRPADWRDVDLAAVECRLLVDGAVVETGLGAAVLGHPFAAVAWLANTLSELGTPIRAGDLVLPGSCTRAVPLAAGTRAEADFGVLGTVSIAVEEGAS